METGCCGQGLDSGAAPGLRTPRRQRRPPNSGFHSAPLAQSRRTLFSADRMSDSELSDISPLSRTSSEVFSPPMPSPSWSASPKRTPLKCISPLKFNFNQLLIGRKSPAKGKVDESPPMRYSLVQHHRVVRSPRMIKGVSPLAPDRGVIEPIRFYGSKEETPLDGVQLLKKIRASLPNTSSARARLFLDDQPRDRKRARSGGAATGTTAKRPPLKRHKKNTPSPPRLLQDGGWKGFQKKKSPREEAARKKRAVEETTTPKTSLMKKRVCNWEVFSFSRPARVNIATEETTPGSEGRKFFRTTVPRNTVLSGDEAGGVLTPPPTVKKSRKLLSRFDWLGGSDIELDDLPEEPEDSEDSKKKIVEEIRDDVLGMMAETEEEDSEVRTEVEELLKSWDDGSDEDDCNDDVGTPVAANQPSILGAEDKENESGISNGSETPKLFPIFAPGHNNFAIKTNTKKKNPLGSANTLLAKRLKTAACEDNQYQIDAGQSSLAETQCATCGLFYTRGDPDDEIQHYAYHNKYNELKFNGWKKERVVGVHDGNDRVVCILKDDPKTWWNKAKAVASVVDVELGFPDVTLDNAYQPKVFLYIRDGKVVGCIIAEIVRKAYRLLEVEPGTTASSGIEVCSEEEYPTRCGISRIWVHHQERRTGIATRMLDAVRRNFCYGMILKLTDVAFSVPTEAGKCFARSYTGRQDFLVYM